MNNNLFYETYIFISSKKLIISVYTNTNENVYKEETELENQTKNINFKTLDNFLDSNIFKIEKSLKTFVKKTSVIIDKDIFFNIDLSVKKKKL